ncbi:MAG: hypothetical protein CSA11_10980 [Chloroflexi bacterium]|nr:MAG: hypothetical protein CSA11_10980 [Chloroflexota bacterium]
MEQNQDMKILAINSSFRGSKGISSDIIDKIFLGARGYGANCESINLVEYNIKRCIGCKKCQVLGNQKRCIFNKLDDVDIIFTKIRNADIVIYSTPIYVLTISSLLKTLLERTFYTSKVDDICVTNTGLFFHDIDTSISSKPFVSLILCDNIETLTTKNAISFFETYSMFTDSENLGILVRKSASLFRETDVDIKKQKIIDCINDAYIEAGKELVTNGRISSKTLSTANQDIIRVPKVIKLLLKFDFFRNNIDISSRIKSERSKA